MTSRFLLENGFQPEYPQLRHIHVKTNQLMMHKAKVAVCFEIRTNHSMQSEHHVEFLNVKPGGT